MVKLRGETHFASPSYLLAFAALWILTEWLRSWIFTGFAWSPLGVIAVPHAAVPARWVGTYGMSGIVFLLAGVLILTLFRRRVAATALFGGVLVLWGAAFVSHMTGRADAAGRSKGTATHPVTVVQPNVGPEDKWEGSKARRKKD